MQEKHQHHELSNGHKTAAGHGNFKHRAKPATLKTMLDAYGMKQSDYVRVRNLVVGDLSKEPAHAR